jgi:xeroderma pigmentosum group C-complementing protein
LFQEPGGFLTAVAGVIQHYSLPRNPHAAPTPGRSPSVDDSDVRDVPIADVDTEAMDETLPVSSAKEDEDQQDEPEVFLLEPPKCNGAIKTMQELAESSSRQQGEIINAQAEGDDGESSDSFNARPKKTTGRTSARGHSTPVAPPGTGRAATTRSGGQSRGQKRARGDSTSATDAEPRPERVSPTKRTRISVATNSTMPASDRVLRTRRTKGAAEIEAEKARERAYKRAIEE